MVLNYSTYFVTQIAKKTSIRSQDDSVGLKNTETAWNRSMAREFFAGWVGGCAGVLVSHPLDTVKVQLQTQDPHLPIYKGTWHCLRVLVATEGPKALYRGLSSPLFGIAFINAVVFGIYGNVQKMLPDPEALASHAMAGSVAGFFQSVVCAPIELSKIRMQLQNKSSTGRKFKNPLEYLFYIRKEHGLLGTMKGLGVTVLRDTPGFASYFLSYEYLMRQPWHANLFYSLFSGGVAGCCSWIVTYPIDVIKTCIQGDDPKKPVYKSYIDCIQHSYRQGGIRFFFRGISSTMIRSFIMNGATFYVVSCIRFREM